MTLGLASVTLVACSSSSPSLYSLQPVAARVPAVNSSFLPLSVPTLVEVRNPTIPQTLDRDRIVLGDGGFKLDVSPSDSWSEPLSSQIPHVLTSDLRQRLPGTSFFAQDDATATTPQAYVELVVNRFSRDAAGNAVLEAQVSVHRADADAVKTNRSLHLSQPAPAGTEGLVSALSALLGQVADQVSQDLKSLPPEPTEAK
ncbi:PqiC family protein [Acetobacter conturbans]|uniref:PqiC family protein n=1 Tax=Acetobacter conturbans TaxID=1737472 RepID=UPI0030CF0BD8